MTEKWVESTYYENTEVSDLGNIRRTSDKTPRKHSMRVRNRATTAEHCVTLHPIGAMTPAGAKAWRTVPLRRVVWETFHGEKLPRGKFVKSLNGDVEDCRLSNLFVMSPHEVRRSKLERWTMTDDYRQCYEWFTHCVSLDGVVRKISDGFIHKWGTTGQNRRTPYVTLCREGKRVHVGVARLMADAWIRPLEKGERVVLDDPYGPLALENIRIMNLEDAMIYTRGIGLAKTMGYSAASFEKTPEKRKYEAAKAIGAVSEWDEYIFG